MREFAAVVGAFAGLAALLTWPLAIRLGTHGYKLHTAGDAQYSVWNIAWVAHALLTDPLNTFNANIFHPNRGTLVYSEANLAAGLLGAPVYWLTGNAFATHNVVVLTTFVLSGTATYYLIRYLVHDWRPAAVGGITFAFCPYAFGHLPHIQLLMTAGIPASLLAFHRLVDQPTIARGVLLGLAMGGQALACAYYAIFVALIIGFVVLLAAFQRARVRDAAYWKAIAAAATMSIVIVVPLFLEYWSLQRDTGFGRTLDESRAFSATWASYRTAAAYAASWFTPPASEWKDTLFPGFIATGFGLAGIWFSWRSGGRIRQDVILYSAIGALALWLSFGPEGGLYALLYRLPGFSFLRAPSRFGVIVTLSLSVLASMGVAEVLRRRAAAPLLVAGLLALAVAERAAFIPITPVPTVEPAYYALAEAPYGAVLDLPPLSENKDYRTARTRFMIGSTVHWKPIVSAYSDHTPADFIEKLPVLASFPTRESLRLLHDDRVRYVVVHLEEYRRNPSALVRLEAGLKEFAPFLRDIFRDNRNVVYEIVGTPP
jgi:hypothetical protein